MSTDTKMTLGNFSISLAVKDLQVSKTFYAKLGFEPVGGDEAQNWLVLQNGPHKIGLFQGMFDANILTFNPGWDTNGKEVESFTDVRDLQVALQSQGIEPTSKADPTTTGPASFLIKDPDGNAILVDQHV